MGKEIIHDLLRANNMGSQIITKSKVDKNASQLVGAIYY